MRCNLSRVANTSTTMKLLLLLSAFVAIDASPLFSLLAGNVVQSYLSSTPQVQTVVVKSQPALTYATLPQPLVVRPYAGDTVVVEAKPTVVYDKPKRIIYRKITCYSDNCDTTSSVSSGGSSTSSFTPTLNSRPLNDFEDDNEGQIGGGRRNNRRGGSQGLTGGGGRGGIGR